MDMADTTATGTGGDDPQPQLGRLFTLPLAG